MSEGDYVVVAWRMLTARFLTSLYKLVNEVDDSLRDTPAVHLFMHCEAPAYYRGTARRCTRGLWFISHY